MFTVDVKNPKSFWWTILLFMLRFCSVNTLKCVCYRHMMPWNNCLRQQCSKKAPEALKQLLSKPSPASFFLVSNNLHHIHLLVSWCYFFYIIWMATVNRHQHNYKQSHLPLGHTQNLMERNNWRAQRIV